MSEEKVFCGYRPLRKGEHRGTAKECLKQNQVRYYGIEQIDPVLITAKKGKSLEQLQVKLASIHIVLSKLLKDYNKEKNEKKKEKLKISLAKKSKEYRKIEDEIKSKKKLDLDIAKIKKMYHKSKIEDEIKSSKQKAFIKSLK